MSVQSVMLASETERLASEQLSAAQQTGGGLNLFTVDARQRCDLAGETQC